VIFEALRGRGRMAVAVVALVFFAAYPWLASRFMVTVLIQCLIMAILAMSLDLMVGYTGMASLGHAAYFGTGAYAAAIMSVHYKAGFTEALAVGLLVAVAVTAVFALVALRAAGVYFLMITFALAMLVWGLAYRWNAMTGGENGIAGVQRPSFIAGTTAYYYFVLAIAAAVFVFFGVLVRSSFGRTLVGIRESESRMQTLGYNVWLHKYLIFLISGLFSGLSGVLWVFYDSLVAPPLVDLSTSFDALLMVSVGGGGTLVGAVLGAVIVKMLENLVNLITDRWLTVVALVYITVVLLAPQGIIGLLSGLMARGGTDRKVLEVVKRANAPVGREGSK
jgi:branched-chain amino acid transport system permease protein